MTKSAEIDAAKLWLVLSKAHRAMKALAEQSIVGTGLGFSDFMVLEALLHKGPLTITEIQQKVLLASGSITAAIDRLEKLGLVTHRLSTDDRRARIVEITREGKRGAKSCCDKHAKDLEALMSVLSDE